MYTHIVENLQYTFRQIDEEDSSYEAAFLPLCSAVFLEILDIQKQTQDEKILRYLKRFRSVEFALFDASSSKLFSHHFYNWGKA
ncbi:hypothetical protein LBCZ_0686 [Lacticaseibacillus casei DSM 20011 = JCM 1134 = ATCC 393]|uniref:Uncharacterized protein n=1 Tax=Lacticaseibacillus casei DSM 20011 = JCM 1134 = ATCC 393 TaxID=1423732 RepID=A0AAD1AMZ4_LACCA|nr:hypothetical protein LBCZ_0686 [Lacticaseibacillus casei DSM 20011 = JCM 1134 = ATCC 393]